MKPEDIGGSVSQEIFCAVVGKGSTDDSQEQTALAIISWLHFKLREVSRGLDRLRNREEAKV